jgi:hypothetical protein
MAALVLDAGALIAIERGQRSTAALLAVAADEGMEVVTSSACVAQVWREPARQARLSRALSGCLERPLDAAQARRCGALLRASGTSDVIDAAVVALARSGDAILTGDTGDIERLLASAGVDARVRGV